MKSKKCILKNKQDIKFKNEFIFVIFLVLIINIFLLYKVKNLKTFIYLLSCLILELSIIFVLIIRKRSFLNILHNIYLFLIILGSLFLKNIYILFIIFILGVAFLTRSIFDVCLFYPEVKKTFNGTLTIIVILIICLFRIYFEKMYKNLFKFN
jgi:hypothetical protein